MSRSSFTSQQAEKTRSPSPALPQTRSSPVPLQTHLLTPLSRTSRQVQRLLQTSSTGQINTVVHASVNNHSVNVATPVNHAETCDPSLLAAGIDILCRLLDLPIDKYGTLLGAVDSVVHIPEKFGKLV